MTNKGIVIIPSWYPTEKDPYAGIYIQEQAKALRAAGLNISVFFVEQCPIPCVAVKSFGLETDIPTYRIKAFAPPKRIKPLRFFWYRKWEQLLKMYIAEFGALPGCLHAHSFVGGAAARYLSLKYNIPYVITEHYDGLISGNVPPHWERELKGIFGAADTVITVSPNLAKGIEKYHRAVEVIPNMINPDLFYPPRSSGIKKDFIHIISVGALEQRKNYSLLLRVFAEIRRRNPVALTIIGEGPLRNALQQQAQSLGVGDIVHFVRGLPPSELAEHLRAADLYVSTSKSESFALAPVEAVACGLPVVILRCGSILESLKLQTVRVVGHPSELEAAIVTFMESMDRDELFLSSQLVRTQFSSQLVTNSLKNVYNRFL